MINIIDLLFPIAGVTLVIIMLLRAVKTTKVRAAPRLSLTEFVLTALALFAPATGPNILVVGLTPGMPEMRILALYALLPSIFILGIIWVVAASLGYERLTNRIWVGIWAGAISTGVLDVIRLTGFSLGQMPGNMPRMFGVLLLDRMALGPTFFSDIIGYTYHYWVGSCFGLAYTLLIGKTRWWGVLIWSIIIEIGMMITPPMVTAMDTGFFGLKFGIGLLITSFIAHVAYGIVMGLLLEKYTLHRGNIIQLLQDFLSLHLFKK